MSGVPVGLDFSAIMTLAAHRGADLELLSDVLPDAETAIVAALAGDPSDED